MEIYILSLKEARGHEPPRDTYAIRLRNSNISPNDTRLWGNLKKSEMYRQVHEYEFDDIYGDFNLGGKLITPDIASKIVLDFKQGKEGCDDLLVHCMAGKGRSPAVAIALNEIFNLGHSSREMRKMFSMYNYFVYQTVIEAAKSIPGLRR